MRNGLTQLTLLFLPTCTLAQVGDTITVQTFTFGSVQNAWFEFPPDSVRFEKILLYYKLKCDPGTTADGYPCGEWDYLTYTYLYEHTGQLDSTLLSHPNFMVGGASPDSFEYSLTPTYTYSPRWEYHIVYDDTLSWNSATVGTGSTSSTYPFHTAGNFGHERVQMLWRASELTASGLSAGDITGLSFLLTDYSAAHMNQMRIGLKHTTLDSVPKQFQDGFITVYEHGTSFSSNNWHSLPFITPFTWDGVSNILIEVCFDAEGTGPTHEVASDVYTWPTMIETDRNDDYLSFDQSDRVDMDLAIFADIDSFVTISFWQYGDPAIQPQDDMILEAIDASGQRQVNVHLPWSNGQVYWDCGNNGTGYDRINKAATTADFEGQWNHWTFTKNVAIGRMEIYLNGKLWHFGTGKTKPIMGVTKLVLGAAASGAYNYDGFIDELYVWNAVLDSATIRQWMLRDADVFHPYHANLVAWFNSDVDWSGIPTLLDKAGGFHGTLFGIPQQKRLKGCEQFRNVTTRYGRPQVIFEQGTFLSHLDSTLVIDSVANPIQQLFIFGDSLNPMVATDTLYVYDAAHSYTFDALGNKTDSVWQSDNTLHQKLNYYYGTPFEVINRHELFRYITPYGIGLNLQNQGDGTGFTWIFDVSDFRTLLKDSVHLSAGNNQEFLDMKFVMIRGTPPRDVKENHKVYSGGHAYNAAIETNFLTPKAFYIPHNVASARLRINNTGHGFGGTLNCSEFCPRTNNVFINGVQRFTEYLWRDDCDLNPVYPQGGTWIYDRANWCPGAEVNPSMFELTPYFSPGDSITIDYNMQSGYTWNGAGSQPYYQIESQLVTYGPNNFNLDASIEDIIAPNSYEGYKRWNPRCDNVIVKIRNTGTQDLTSLRIEHGPKTGPKTTHQWSGNLKFLEEEIVELPAVSWGSWTGPNIFEATISNPNGGQDQYARNNSISVPFKSTPMYPANFYLQFQTNNAAYESSYKLFDHQGNVVYQRNNMSNATTYRDTFQLATGCYRLVIYDSGEDGLSFFANNDGNGTARLREVGGATFFKTFEPNFGGEIAQSFTIGYQLGIQEQELQEVFWVYPNPSDGRMTVDVQLSAPESMQLFVADGMDRIVMSESYREWLSGTVHLDLTHEPSGLYLVMLRTGDRTRVQKIILK